MSESDDDSALDPQRRHGLRIIRNAMVPLTDEDGRARHFGPYKPVLDACNICPARCCRFTVKVSIPDAVRFCVTLGLPFFSGLHLVMGDGPRSFRVTHDARIFTQISAEHWGGSADIVLRRSEDGSCAHLLNIGGFERCGVYSARPSTCRLYPVVWESDEAQGGPALISCPVAYGLTPTMEQQFYEDAAQSIESWQLHDNLLKQWHERSEDQDNWDVMSFLEFVVSRAAEHMNLDASNILAPGSAYEQLAQAMRQSGTLKD